MPWVLDEIEHKKSPVKTELWSGRRDSNSRPSPWQGDALPLSHFRKWCPEPESNQRHADFQSAALPTELSGQGCLTTFVYITEIS